MDDRSFLGRGLSFDVKPDRITEPRIQDIQVTIDESNTEGCLMINISYVVRATNNPYNLVFPFYLEEGGGDSY